FSEGFLPWEIATRSGRSLSRRFASSNAAPRSDTSSLSSSRLSAWGRFFGRTYRCRELSAELSIAAFGEGPWLAFAEKGSRALVAENRSGGGGWVRPRRIGPRCRPRWDGGVSR